MLYNPKARHHTMPRLQFQRKERGKSDSSTILCGFGQVISGQDKDKRMNNQSTFHYVFCPITYDYYV